MAIESKHIDERRLAARINANGANCFMVNQIHVPNENSRVFVSG